MFYVIDYDGNLHEAPTLKELMEKCDGEDGDAYGSIDEWLIFQGTKIEVEKKVDYIVKTQPKKPAAKKPVAKKAPAKTTVKK